MPIALPTRPRGADAAAFNDNGADLGAVSRRMPRGGFWLAVRQAAQGGARLDYLAPGVMRIAGCAFARP